MKHMKIYISAFLAAAICFLTPAAVSAEMLSEYESVIYNNENGLDSASANAVIQSSDGYIWIGTYTGLYRYDGRSFMLTDTDKGINNVRSLFIDSYGRMWVGTNDNGAAVYENGQVTFYNKNNGLSSNSIRCFGEDGMGNIYVGSTGVLNIIGSDGTVKTFDGNDSLSYINSLCSSSDGTVAGITNSGTMFFILPDGSIAEAIGNANPDQYYSCITAKSDGSFIAGSSGSDVYQCAINNGVPTVSKLITLDDISGMAEIREEGKSLIVCGDNGIVKITETLNTEVLSNESFNSNITGFIKDYQNNYWFVSSRQGAMKLTRNPFIKSGGDGVANAVEIHDGLIYTACDDGLKINSEESGRIIENQLTKMLDGVRIRHIMTDSDGRLWLSTYGTSGLFRYTPSDGSFTVYNESDSGTLGSRFRFSYQLNDGTVIAATPNGLSFIKDGEVTDTLGTDEGLKMPQILCAVEMPDGTILAGSDGDGIYGIKDGAIKFNIGEEQGLDSLVVMRIVPYKNNWLLVTGNAVYLLDNSLSVKRISSFYYSNNFDIIPDINGQNLWITSSAGVFCVDGEKLLADSCGEYELFNRKNGLNTSLTANSWNHIDSSGNIYLCCNDGIRKFSSADLQHPDADFELNINSVTLGDGTVLTSQPADGYSGKFVIPAETSRLSFSPAALNFTLSDPEISIYMEGFDETGVTVKQSELNDVSFTNLPHGTYYFHIGTGSKEAVFLIEKAARFYETAQFKAYLLAVGIGAVAFITWVITKIGSLSLIKRQYEEIRLAKEDAEKANSAKSTFLANISHEIRTPINTMLGMNEMILRENGGEAIERYALNIKTSGHTLLSIINDILDLSKIESGSMSIVPDKYDIVPTITNLVNMFEFRAAEKKLYFNAEISPDIPRFLYGDELRIRQIITNLLSNAVKYTEKGGITLKIRCEKSDGDFVLLAVTVEDTGIGIKDEDKERVFKNFERLDEHRNKGIEGTGLGLSITSNLLSMMGSKLEFMSQYGSGSAFGFSLKQKAMSDETVGKINFGSSNTHNEGYHYAASFTAPDAKLLAVDDNVMNLEVIRGLLKKTMVQIDTAESGTECLELIAQKHYDIIFLDHMMPEMNGIETLNKIREGGHKCADTPVIVLTANAVSGARENYIGIGFTDYISKPIDCSELEEKIVQYLPDSLLTGSYASQEQGLCGFSETVHINVETGLNYTDHSEELYRSILEIYYNSSGNAMRKLKTAFENEDIRNYEIVVHSIKSTSLGIGAEELSSKAKQLEYAAKDGDTDFIRTHHEDVVKLYNEVIKEIGHMLGKE
ncbi:MAG: response regulator [Oscillospiraceae bacterium]|nr:response regulator [Oscillospiraceae bacterium]